MPRIEVKLSGAKFKDVVPDMKKKLDLALGNTLQLQQTELSKANPIDTGRMASSWFISQNKPEYGSRPESWGSPGAARREVSEYPLEGIKFEGNWFITNAVPYAAPICLLGGYPKSWGGSAPTSIPKDWYTSIVNQTVNVFNKEYRKVGGII